MYVGPAFAVTFVLMLLPLAYLVEGSTKDWELGRPLGASPSVGTDNFSALFDGPVSLMHALGLSAIYTSVSLVAELVLGLCIALLLTRRLRGMSILTSAFLVPMVVMPAMAGMTWRLYFDYNGLVNWLLSLPGIGAVNWYSPEWALPAVIITDIWQWTPFFVLILLAGLQSLPQEPIDAARVDGASGWQLFRLVKLPLLMPLIIITCVLRVMELLRSFDVVFTMFRGGPGDATQTLPVAVYQATIGQRNAGVGAALSLVLILLTLVIAGAFVLLIRRWRTT